MTARHRGFDRLVGRVAHGAGVVAPSAYREVEGFSPEGPVQTQEVVYLCASGHEMTLTMHHEAEVPTSWDCRYCSKVAGIVGALVAVADDLEDLPGRHMRTVRLRRTDAELQALLDERLAILRARRGQGEPAAGTLTLAA